MLRKVEHEEKRQEIKEENSQELWGNHRGGVFAHGKTEKKKGTEYLKQQRWESYEINDKHQSTDPTSAGNI